MSQEDDIRSRVRDSLSQEGLDGEKLERAIFNSVIRRCKLMSVICSWSNSPFLESYKSSAMSIIRNHEAVAALIGSGVTESEVVLKEPYDFRPEVWHELLEKKKEKESSYKTKPTSNTSMYRCRKCKSRECYSFGLQTRSGDEPMTVFVTCLNCGNRWRTEG